MASKRRNPGKDRWKVLRYDRHAELGPDWYASGYYYYARHDSSDTKELESLKKKIEDEITRFHPAVQKMIRVWINLKKQQPQLELEVCGHYVMEYYLDEPGARKSFSVDMHHLDDFLMTLNF